MAKYNIPHSEDILDQRVREVQNLYLRGYEHREVAIRSGMPKEFCTEHKPKVQVDNIVRKAKQLLAKGMEVAAVAKKLKVTTTFIRKKCGVPTKVSKLHAKVRDLRRRGYGLKHIAEVTGYSYQTVRTLVARYKVKPDTVELDMSGFGGKETTEALNKLRQEVITDINRTFVQDCERGLRKTIYDKAAKDITDEIKIRRQLLFDTTYSGVSGAVTAMLPNRVLDALTKLSLRYDVSYEEMVGAAVVNLLEFAGFDIAGGWEVTEREVDDIKLKTAEMAAKYLSINANRKQVETPLSGMETIGGSVIDTLDYLTL